MPVITEVATKVLNSSKLSLFNGRVSPLFLRKYQQHPNSRHCHVTGNTLWFQFSNGSLLCSRKDYLPNCSRSKSTSITVENDMLSDVKSKGKNNEMEMRGTVADLGDPSEGNEAVGGCNYSSPTNIRSGSNVTLSTVENDTLSDVRSKGKNNEMEMRDILADLGDRSEGTKAVREYRKVRPGRSLDLLTHLDYLGREVVQEHSHLFLPLEESQSWVNETEDTLIKMPPSEEKIKAATRKADELALYVILMKETFDRLPAEVRERKRLGRTLILENVNTGPSNDAASQEQHDRNEVEQYFRLLGQRTVYISRIERCLAKKRIALKVTVREQMAKKLLAMSERMVHEKGVKMSSGYTPLQLEYRRLLVREMIIRNIVSESRSDPWYWKMDNRVRRKPKQSRYDQPGTKRFKNYTRVLERLVDELVESREFFTEVDETDYHHLRHKESKDRDILIMNLEVSLQDEFEQVNRDVESVRELFRYLGIPPYVIREIRPTTSKHQKAPGLIVTLEDRSDKLKVLERVADLRHSPHHYMRDVFIRPSTTLLQQYIDELKVQEVKARNEILARKNEPGRWLLKSGSVRFIDGSYYSKPSFTPNKHESESDLA